MIQLALPKFAVAILVTWLVPCIDMHAAVNPRDQAKISSLNKKVLQLHQAGKFADHRTPLLIGPSAFRSTEVGHLKQPRQNGA